MKRLQHVSECLSDRRLKPLFDWATEVLQFAGSESQRSAANERMSLCQVGPMSLQDASPAIFPVRVEDPIIRVSLLLG